MVRTIIVLIIIHGARIGGRCPNGVQHTGIKFPSYCGGEGGGAQSGQGLLVLPPRCEIFLMRTLDDITDPDFVPMIQIALCCQAVTRWSWST